MSSAATKIRSDEYSKNYEGESIEKLVSIVDETLSQRHDPGVCILRASERK